jgi:hypothetical protein
VHFADEDIIKFKEYENYDEQTKIFLLLTIVKNLISKYGNISQIFGNEILKKNILKQCLINYDLTEKEEGDKDYVNLEELSHEIKLKNENEIKEFNEQMDNKFKVIKEVDEDKEEENDEEEEEIKDSNEKKENKNSNTNTNNKKESKINSKTNSKSNSNEKNKSEENEINKNLDMDVDMDLNDIDIKDEDIIEKILLEDFKKNYKENKYFFEKIGFNEYLYNNIKVRGLIDKDGDIKIMLEENNEEYYLDDFIKLFNEEKDNGFEKNKNSNNGNDDNINFDMNINSDNKEIIENINNISDINNDKEYKEIESEEEKNNENNKIEKDDNNRENGM